MSDYDTSLTVKISHYTVETTSSKMYKTLLDKNHLSQRRMTYIAMKINIKHQ